MYIADIIPLAFIPRSQEQVFSYFLPRELPRGAMVEIPIGRRIVQGVVMMSRPVRGSKLEIRKGAFAIKSIKSVISETPAYTNAQMDLFFWISETYWAPLGKAFALTPANVKIHEAVDTTRSKPETVLPVFIRGADRSDAYIELVKKCLVKKMHTLILCPDSHAAKELNRIMSEQVETQAILYSGRAGKKQLAKTIASVQDPTKPCIIIGTRSAIFLPFANIGTLIIDSPGDASYDAWGRIPKYHAVETAEKIAQLYGAELAYGDILPTANLLRGIREHRLRTVKTSAISASYPAPTIIDLRNEKYWSSRHMLTPPLRDALCRAIRGIAMFEPNSDIAIRKQAVIFINRKGTATAYICKTCGHIPRCPNCEAAMVLHSANIGDHLRCHHCGFRQEAPKQCPKCKSYKIFPVGAGTEQVETDLKKLVPEARILRIDSDSAKNENELEKKLHAFRNKEADILVCTQLAVKWPLLPQVEISAILNPETFFAFPTYNAAERAYRLFETMRQKTKGTFFLQTLNPELPALNFFSNSEHEKFLEAELELRQAFSYPPFGRLIRLIISHASRDRAEWEARRLAQELGIWNQGSGMKATILGPSPAFLPKERGKWKFVLLLKFPGLTSDESVITLLEKVPPGWQVDVNPKELL